MLAVSRAPTSEMSTLGCARHLSANGVGGLSADDIQLLAPQVAPIPIGYRSFRVADLLVRGDRLMDRDQTFSVPLTDLLILPLDIAAMLTFKPFPAADQPSDVSGVGRWAVERGLPPRVFCVCDGEPKAGLCGLRQPLAHAQPAQDC